METEKTTSSTEITGFRAWLRSKAKMITLYTGAVVGILTLGTTWIQLDMPRPAFNPSTTSEISELRLEVASNKELILGDKWFRLKSRIREVEARLAREPGNRDLIQELTRLEQQLRAVERELK